MAFTTERIVLEADARRVASASTDVRKLTDEVGKLTTRTRESASAQEQANRQFTMMNTAIQNVQRSLVGLATGYLGIQGVRMLKDFATGVYEARLSLEAAANVVNRQVLPLGTSYTRVIGDMRKATLGLVDDVTLLQNTGRAMLAFTASGLSASKAYETITTAAQFAALSSRAFGIEAEHAMDRIITGLARGSPQILDDFGIMIDLQDDMFKGLDQTAQKAAVLNEVMVQMNRFIGENEDQLRSLVPWYERWATAIKNVLAGGPSGGGSSQPFAPTAGDAQSLVARLERQEVMRREQVAAATGARVPRSVADTGAFAATMENRPGYMPPAPVPARPNTSLPIYQSPYLPGIMPIPGAGDPSQIIEQGVYRGFRRVEMEGKSGESKTGKPRGFAERFTSAAEGTLPSFGDPATFLGGMAGDALTMGALGLVMKPIQAITGRLFGGGESRAERAARIAAEKQLRAAEIQERAARTASGFSGAAGFQQWLGSDSESLRLQGLGVVTPGAAAGHTVLAELQSIIMSGALSEAVQFIRDNAGAFMVLRDTIDLGDIASWASAVEQNTDALERLNSTLRRDLAEAQIRSGYAEAAAGARSDAALRNITGMAFRDIDRLNAGDTSNLGDYGGTTAARPAMFVIRVEGESGQTVTTLTSASANQRIVIDPKGSIRDRRYI